MMMEVISDWTYLETGQLVFHVLTFKNIATKVIVMTHTPPPPHCISAFFCKFSSSLILSTKGNDFCAARRGAINCLDSLASLLILTLALTLTLSVGFRVLCVGRLRVAKCRWRWERQLLTKKHPHCPLMSGIQNLNLSQKHIMSIKDLAP